MTEFNTDKYIRPLQIVSQNEPQSESVGKLQEQNSSSSTYNYNPADDTDKMNREQKAANTPLEDSSDKGNGNPLTAFCKLLGILLDPLGEKK